MLGVIGAICGLGILTSVLVHRSDWLTPVLASIAYIGVFSTVVAYVFWNRAVQQVGANRAGPFMYLMLVYTPLLAIVFLDERLYLYHLIGCALILGGIALTARGGVRPAATQEPPAV